MFFFGGVVNAANAHVLNFGSYQFPSNFHFAGVNAFHFRGLANRNVTLKTNLDFVGSYGYDLENQKPMANLPFLNPQFALVIKNG